MKKNGMKIIALAIALLLTFQTIPAEIFADEAPEAMQPAAVETVEEAPAEEITLTEEEEAPAAPEARFSLPSRDSSVMAASAVTYQITWQDEDGTVLAVSEVEKGKMPVYEGETPVKEADLHYTYEFSGWTPTVRTASANKTYTAVYKKTAIQYTVTLNFFNIPKADGTMTSSTESNKLGAGTGWNFTQKKLDNKILCKSYTSYGIKYTYTGTWMLEDGTVHSGTYSIKGADLTGDTVISLSPIYEATPIWHLEYNYIDNISTGSGSWSNIGSFDGYTHTFKEPEAQPHYRFVNWTEEGTGKVYMPGESYVFPDSAKVSGSKTVVNTYAMWQPSATVRYYSADGSTLLNEIEAFESLNVYDWTPETGSDSFLGWYAEPGVTADGALGTDTAAALPEITSERVERSILNVYARTATAYTVEHYLEDLDGSYSILESETEIHENAVVGSEAEAGIKEFEGFTFNGDIEGTQITGTVAENGGLVLKAFYSRNSYTVTYKYEGKIPSGASKLPEEATVRYGEEVTVAGNAKAKGYTFSGWDTEDFTMPAENVVISGSFKAIPEDKTDEQPPVVPDPTPAHTDPVVPEDPEDKPAEPETDPDPVIVIPEETIPQAVAETEIYEENAIPTVGVKTWALINLISAVMTAVLSLGMILTFFRRKEEDEDEGEENSRRRPGKLLGVVPAAAAVIAFLFTENMRNLMVLTDRWTLFMVAILIVNAVLAIVTRNRKDDAEEQNA